MYVGLRPTDGSSDNGDQIIGPGSMLGSRILGCLNKTKSIPRRTDAITRNKNGETQCGSYPAHSKFFHNSGSPRCIDRRPDIDTKAEQPNQAANEKLFDYAPTLRILYSHSQSQKIQFHH